LTAISYHKNDNIAIITILPISFQYTLNDAYEWEGIARFAGRTPSATPTGGLKVNCN